MFRCWDEWCTIQGRSRRILGNVVIVIEEVDKRETFLCRDRRDG